jgi:hypothetical protein
MLYLLPSWFFPVPADMIFYSILFIPSYSLFFYPPTRVYLFRPARSLPSPSFFLFFLLYSSMGYETVKDLTAGTVGGIAQVHSTLVRVRSCHLTVPMPHMPPGPRRSAFRHTQSGMFSPKPFNINRVEPNVQRMQTAPPGTYSGMLHCAGGILKNEGPFAFYKVSLPCWRRSDGGQPSGT